MAKLSPAIQFIELKLTLYFLHQSGYDNVLEAINKITLSLTYNLPNFALCSLGISHILLLDPLKALPHHHPLPIPHLLKPLLAS